MAQSSKQRLQRSLDALATASDSIARLDAARRLRETAELLEQEAVKAARRDGRSWSAIGAVYGMSKQGAQQRFRAEKPSRADREREPKNPTA